MKQCKCEHWQECPVCQPSRFDADGNRLPPEPTPLQAARAQIEKDEALLRQALEAMETLKIALRVGMPEYGSEDEDELLETAITALRVALAEPDVPETDFGNMVEPQVQDSAAWAQVPPAFNDWWDSEYSDPTNPFRLNSAAYWAWAGWRAALMSVPDGAEQPAEQSAKHGEPVATDGMIAELEQENRLLRARNERLELEANQMREFLLRNDDFALCQWDDNVGQWVPIPYAAVEKAMKEKHERE